MGFRKLSDRAPKLHGEESGTDQTAADVKALVGGGEAIAKEKKSTKKKKTQKPEKAKPSDGKGANADGQPADGSSGGNCMASLSSSTGLVKRCSKQEKNGEKSKGRKRNIRGEEVAAEAEREERNAEVRGEAVDAGRKDEMSRMVEERKNVEGQKAKKKKKQQKAKGDVESEEGVSAAEAAAGSVVRKQSLGDEVQANGADEGEAQEGSAQKGSPALAGGGLTIAEEKKTKKTKKKTKPEISKQSDGKGANADGQPADGPPGGNCRAVLASLTGIDEPCSKEERKGEKSKGRKRNIRGVEVAVGAVGEKHDTEARGEAADGGSKDETSRIVEERKNVEGQKAKKKKKQQKASKGGGGTAARAFQRVKVEEVSFKDPRLKDNSYWSKGGAETGWGAKAQEILGRVRGKDFRHEKTKKKRGSYRGGSIDLGSHSIKFDNSDDDDAE